jgi:xyloglucan-specific exo-beta-1,4-glucanase
MIHGLSINPFDSNHFLYGTGLSVWGSHDLLNWDQRAADVNGTRKNITLSSLADGMEMTAVLGLASPPGNYSDANRVRLVSALGDIGGFVHRNLSAVPQIWENPIWVGVRERISCRLHLTD